MKSLKIGVLGVSSHFFKRCYLALKNSKEINVYAIASRNGDKSREAAKKWGIPVHYDSYESLLADETIEAVYIPLPNHMHKEWIKKCVDAGKHIICEKPITLDANEANDVMAYAKEHNIKLMEAFMYRFHPKWLRTKEIITAGGIGKVSSIHTIFSYNNSDPNNIRNIKKYGGGAVYDIGCYAISTARYILGKEPLKVIALAENDPDFDTDMLTSAILDFDGPRCLFTVSTQSYDQQEVNIYGTSGKITVTVPFNDFSDVKSSIIVETSLGKRTVEFDPADQYLLEFKAFARSIKKDLDVPLDSKDSIHNMKVIDAVFESIKSGTWVNLD